jgi:sugar/nucleoside kinase (ribokinase family)
VIVVVGNPVARPSTDGPAAAGGLPARVAIAAVAAGGSAQIVGRVGEDPAGEAVLLDLARHGVGHAAVLRDPTRPTQVTAAEPDDDAIDDAGVGDGAAEASISTLDAADLQLAFDYLPEYAVIVVAESLAPRTLAVAVGAATWSGSALVVVGSGGFEGLPETATVFEPPEHGDPDGAFAAMVGGYAAGLDRGEDPKAAFDAASSAVGSSATNQVR